MLLSGINLIRCTRDNVTAALSSLFALIRDARVIIFSLTGDGLPNAAPLPAPTRIQDSFIMKISVSRAVADVPLGNSCSYCVASLGKRGGEDARAEGGCP